MKSRVICQRCGKPLSAWLEPVGKDFIVSWQDEENIVPRGFYWIADEDMGSLEGRVVIHLDDRLGMLNHPDVLRFQGCCGPSAGMVNLLCECGAEVATEVSDCWTSYYAHFEPEVTGMQRIIEESARKELDGESSSDAQAQN